MCVCFVIDHIIASLTALINNFLKLMAENSVRKPENINEYITAPCTILHSSTCPRNTSLDNKKKSEKKRLIIASVLCLIFMIVEIIGGIMSGSLAIAADAAHLLTDFGAFMISLFALFVSSKKRTALMNFGFHRVEIIGALASILSIWFITGILIYMAIQRLIERDFEIDSTVMLAVAIYGIIANITIAIILSITEIHQILSAKFVLFENCSINLKTALIHVLGDIIYSTGLLLASLIIYYKPSYKIADTICTLLFSVIVLITTYGSTKDVLFVLMEGVPRYIAFHDVQQILFSISHVVKVHSLRMWSLTMEKVALSAHIVISKDGNPTNVLKEATAKLSDSLDIFEITLQIEDDDKDSSSCRSCS